MASAVLASNNEAHWGANVYHRHTVNNAVNRTQFAPISNPNPNPNSNVQSRQIKIPNPIPQPTWQDEAATQGNQPPPPPDDVISHRDYVTINLSEYSRAELRELERRLRAELDQVRQVRTRIETINVVSGPKPPPAILSSKPSKKVAGKKRAVSLGPNRELKRLAIPTSPELDGISKKMMTRCSQMLGKLMKHKHAWIFNKPVDTVGLGLRDYFDIIDQPMDLGTVKAKLKVKEYKNPNDFASDVRLTFKNAMKYNPKGQDAHIMADALLGIFEKMYNPAIKKFENEKGRLLAALGMNFPTMIDVPNPKPMLVRDALPDHRPAEVEVATNPGPIQRLMPKMPKPNPKDTGKMVMTFEEKEKLGMFLQELPSNHMETMLDILRKRNTGIVQEGDEIELDFEALDNETLWELDKFVNNLKKAENKMKSQAPAQVEKSPVIEPMPDAAQHKSTKVDAMEEDVDIGEDIPLNNFPPVEIEKDTNCSSSSGGSSSGSDSSSSSGSGSVSSSGSDSEEDSVQSPYVEPK